MSPRALVYSVIAAAALIPATVRAGASNSLTAPTSVPAGAKASLLCTFQCVAGGMSFCNTTADRFVFTSTSGSFPSGGTSQTVLAPPSATSTAASIVWTAPEIGGNANVTCQARTATAAAATLATRSVTVTEPLPDAPVIAEIRGPTAVFAEDAATFTAVASDPGGLPITYSWSSSGGSFSPASPTGPSATWIAPAAAGGQTITVTATNSGGSAAQLPAVVSVVLSAFQGSLDAAMRAPRRLAVGAQGDIYVADGNFRFSMLTKRGELRGSLALSGVTAVAAAGSAVYAATEADGILVLDAVTSRLTGRIPYPFARGPDGMAVDVARTRAWVANHDAGTVYALSSDGSVTLQIDAVPTHRFVGVTDVAYDAVRDELWVAEFAYEGGPMVHAFRAADATYLRSYVPRGTGAGQVMSVGGIAVANGKLAVSDSYSGTVQVLAAVDGAPLGAVGQTGMNPGDLYQPRGVGFLANGDIAVANSGLHRIDRFGTGAGLPACDGDADCDGLPDAWELANGMNPGDASDALADSDADGLFNVEELAYGTDPRRADTDGDLVSDGQEVAAGSNPLDGPQSRPVVSIPASTESLPGLVRLNAVVTGGESCVPSWRQVAGGGVSLRDAGTFTPSFVARARDTYGFEVIATCSGGASLPTRTNVVLSNARPIADAGHVVVTAPDRRVNLSGAYSSDANGDALGYSWRQVAGPATNVASRGSVLAVRSAQPGFYAYELTAQDSAGERATAVVPVVVSDGGAPTAAVAVPVVVATVGSPVALDASASSPADVAYSWQQVEPAQDLVLEPTARPSFTPTAPGRYVFEVSAWKGGVRSPPARVVVLAGVGGVVPTATASAPLSGRVNAPLVLDGSASSGEGLRFAWRQAEGPAAGLTDSDSSVATVVPFAAGFYSFELTVSDATGASGRPARVSFTVPGAKPVPVASVSAPATGAVGEGVVLDGRGSTPGVRYRWTQLSGPWVVLDVNSATPDFTPLAAGSYRFALVVEDGAVRSAPAIATVDVQ